MSPLAKWLLYDCTFALIPIAGAWFAANWILGKRTVPADVIRDGQLFFYCSTLSAAALGDVVTVANPIPGKDYWVFGFIVSIIFATLFYGAAFLSEDQNDKDRVALSSSIFALAATALVGFFRDTYGIF